jgi:hypothetical protein
MLPRHIKEYIKEFFTASFVGVIIGAVTLGSRYVTVSPIQQLIACAAFVAFAAVVLRAPNPAIIVLSLIVLIATWKMDPQTNFLVYAAFLLAVTYVWWAVFEAARHFYRVASYLVYRRLWTEYWRGDIDLSEVYEQVGEHLHDMFNSETADKTDK